MIYQLKQVLIDIKSVSTNPKRNLIVGKNGEILKNGEVIFKGGKYSFANNLINENYYNYGDNQYQFLFENDMEIFLNNYVTNSISAEGVIVFENEVITDTIKQDNYYLKFSDNSKILLNENAVGGFILNYDNNAKSIFRSYNKLSSYSLLTGEYEWELDLGGRLYNLHGEEKEAYIQQIIGIWEGVLLVSLSNSNIIGIDTVMGKILWEKCPWAGFVSLSGGLASPTLEQNSLFWYSFGAYFEFHLPTLTGKLLKEYLHTDKSMPPFAIKRSVYTEEYIYFTASQKSMILSNIVGVFNRKTLEIDWQEELDILPKTKSDPFTSLTDIQLGNNKLYVLDSEGTLHIFEREG